MWHNSHFFWVFTFSPTLELSDCKISVVTHIWEVSACAWLRRAVSRGEVCVFAAWSLAWEQTDSGHRTTLWRPRADRGGNTYLRAQPRYRPCPCGPLTRPHAHAHAHAKLVDHHTHTCEYIRVHVHTFSTFSPLHLKSAEKKQCDCVTEFFLSSSFSL